MSQIIHVNGGAQLQTGTGSANALENLGYSVDGVSIELIHYEEPVMTDLYGPKMPYDVQYCGMQAFVTCDLVLFDSAVLTKIMGGFQGTTEGLLAPVGQLYVTASGCFRLVVTSPNDAIPYNFPLTYLQDAQSVKIGTMRTIWKLKFAVLPAQSTSGSSGQVLFNRTTS